MECCNCCSMQALHDARKNASSRLHSPPLFLFIDELINCRRELEKTQRMSHLQAQKAARSSQVSWLGSRDDGWDWIAEGEVLELLFRTSCKSFRYFLSKFMRLVPDHCCMSSPVIAVPLVAETRNTKPGRRA